MFFGLNGATSTKFNGFDECYTSLTVTSTKILFFYEPKKYVIFSYCIEKKINLNWFSCPEISLKRCVEEYLIHRNSYWCRKYHKFLIDTFSDWHFVVWFRKSLDTKFHVFLTIMMRFFCNCCTSSNFNW